MVDQLLAAITREGDRPALDAALDFRLLLAEAADPIAVLRGYFELRSVAEERHYLAFYRLRRWLENSVVAVVHVDRSDVPRCVGLRLDLPSFGALYAQCAVTATDGLPPQAWTRVHFALAQTPASRSAQLPLPIA